MKRLFVALEISEKVKQKISPLLDSFLELDADLRIVPQNNLHLTLKFLGEVDDSELRKVKDELSLISENFEKFEIRFEKVGFFPSWKR